MPNKLIIGVEPNSKLKPAITRIIPLTKAEKFAIVLFMTVVVYFGLGVLVL